MDDIEPARDDLVPRLAIRAQQPAAQRLGAVPLRPRQLGLVGLGRDGVQREIGRAVAAREQGDLMPLADQLPDQRIAMRFHAPHERRGDRMADMRDHGDPQGGRDC